MISPEIVETPFTPCVDVLGSFPGIWYTTTTDGSLIMDASENYCDKGRGEWRALRPTQLPNGLIVHWLIQAQ
jgi:hypothetical protein